MSSSVSEAALQRAYAAIEKAETTLAQPRAEGSAWVSGTVEPVPHSVPVRRSVEASPPANPYVTSLHLKSILSSTAKITGAAIKERDAKINDLERRLASLEALIAKARGATQ